MIVSLIKKDGYIKEEKIIKNTMCNLCKGYNTKNNKCYDCMKEADSIFYYRRNLLNKKHTLNLKFPLSEKQKEASNFFLNLFINHESGYLNAVCGSGKTEIMYETILYALNLNKKVLIAIPRREIVSELKERLTDAFVNTSIKQLDMYHHDYDADLLISTVNQLVNFENEFDLIIVDEVDAYPFSGNAYLNRLVKKALKEESSLFLMSATETEKINYKKFTISRRYHNHDLSMPKFYKENDPVNSKIFKDIILNNNRKYILYVKSIKEAKRISDLLNTYYVSSENKRSKDIIDSFKKGMFNILVSTTLLERGITIINTDVIIFEADNSVFTSQVIIQICGRVGRKYEDNEGSIYIFYKRNMMKFKSVKRYIKRMNEM